MAYIDYANLLITLTVMAVVIGTCRYVWKRYL
jgi:hypothetical protein